MTLGTPGRDADEVLNAIADEALEIVVCFANDKNSARSVWTVEPANGGRAYFTIVADADFPPAISWLLRPLLARMFYRLNFPTFIRAAEDAQDKQAPEESMAMASG